MADSLPAAAPALCPTVVEELLEGHPARCLAFNRPGTLLATGSLSGEVVLWDFETRGAARVLSGGHSAEVLAVAWSRDGRLLASACTGSQLCLWNLEAGGAPMVSVSLRGKPVRQPVHGAERF